MEDKTFLEHLEDLRFVLLKSFLIIVLFSGAAFFFAPHLLKGILWPFQTAVARFHLECPTGAILRTLRPTGAFMMAMKLAFGAGFTVALPLVLYYGGRFVLPGLTFKERRYLLPALAAGTTLFLIGMAFCYFIVLPAALAFFWSYGQCLGIANEWVIDSYVSLVIQLLLAFGIVFELPVVLLFLVKLGIVGYEGLRKNRRYVIVAIFIIAALITPTPDVITQILLAVPMILLYELCVLAARWMGRKGLRSKD